MKGSLIRRRLFHYIVHLVRTTESVKYEYGVVISDEKTETIQYGLSFYSGDDTYDVEMCYIEIYWLKTGEQTREYLPLDVKLELL
jgi:hypothetical protein